MKGASPSPDLYRSWLRVILQQCASAYCRSAFLEHVLRNGQRRKCTRPAGIKGEMRDHFCCLLCPVEMIRNLRGLATGNQGAHRDQTSIAGSKVRAEPQIAEQDIGGIAHDSGSHRPKLLFDAGRAFVSAS